MIKTTRHVGTMANLIVFTVITGSTTHAALSIDVGNHLLQPNLPGQTVDFFVAGGDSVTGLEFDIQIGGNIVGPTITNIDLKTGTIFSDAAFLEADTVRNPRQAQNLATSTGASVLADGKIAAVTFDTTGVPPGMYDLDLTDVAGAFDTTFFNGANPIATRVTNGTITIVPEPASAALIGLSAIGVLFGMRKRRKFCAC